MDSATVAGLARARPAGEGSRHRVRFHRGTLRGNYKKEDGRAAFGDRWSMGEKKWTRTWERRDWTRLRLLGLLSPSAAANPLVTEEVAIASFPKLDGSVVELSHDLPEREVRPVWTSLGARARSIE